MNKVSQRFWLNLTTDTEKYRLSLEDGVLAYFSLAAANLSDDYDWRVRATTNLELNEIKNKLKRVFGEYDRREGDEHAGTLPVKEESLYKKDTVTVVRHIMDLIKFGLVSLFNDISTFLSFSVFE